MRLKSIVRITWEVIGICLVGCKGPYSGQLSGEGAATIALSPCYRYEVNRDTVQLHLIAEGDTVTGTLVYRFFEQDAIAGTVRGTVAEGVLRLEYTFTSAGKNGIREMVFLYTDEGLMEGYGEREEVKDKLVFKSYKSIVYNGNMLLKPVPC